MGSVGRLARLFFDILQREREAGLKVESCPAFAKASLVAEAVAGQSCSFEAGVSGRRVNFAQPTPAGKAAAKTCEGPVLVA